MAKIKYYATPSYLKPFDAEEENKKMIMKKYQPMYGNTNLDKNIAQRKIDDANYVKPKVFQDMPKSYKNDYVKMKDFRVAEIAKKPTYLEPKKEVKKPFANMLPPAKKVVQQGKVPVQGIKRVDNPFAPLLVNALNTASFGALEANNKGISQLHQQSPITSTIGSMAGYALPFSAGAKLAKPLTSKIAKPLAKRVIEGAVVGSGVEALSGLVGQRGLEQTKKNVAYGAALGGAADVALYGAGKLVSKGIQKFGKKATESVIPTSNAITPRNSLTQPQGAKQTFTRPKVETKIETTNNLLPDPKIVSSNKADKTTLGQKFNKLYTATVDKNKSISDFSKAANDKTYTLATNSASQKNIADYIMTDKLVNKKGESIGKSLKEVFKDIPQDKENGFMNYALEKHNIARAREDFKMIEKVDKQGFLVKDKNGVQQYDKIITKKSTPVFPNRTSEQSAAKVAEIEKLNPEWKNKSSEITKWIGDFMDEWGVKAGTLDEGLSKANKATYPDYIPTNRDFSALEQAGGGYGNGNKGFLNQTTPIKRATGSSRDIIDPRENIANMVVRTVKAAKNNEVGQNLVNSIRENPEKLGKFAEIVTEPKGNVSNIVRVLENGKPVYVKLNDLGLLKAMQNLNTIEIGGVERFSKQITGAFKQLITQKNPVFAIRNIARDVPTAYVYGSEANPLKFGMDLLKAGKKVVSNSKEFQQYKALGGGGANFFDSGNPAKSIKELTSNNTFKKILNTIPKGIEKFNNITESAPRFAEFTRVLKKSGDVDKALFAANDVTTNFSRGGSTTKFVDSFVPYLNAGVQGLDKAARQFTSKPLQTLGKGIAGVTAPALAFNYLNKDNENYKALDNRTKDNYFLIPNGDTFIKIPKSRELGVLFGSLAERTLRAKQGDEQAFKGFGNTVKTNFSPANPFDASITAPLASNIPKNKDFADRAIIPQSMLQDGRSPKYQYDEKTSMLAKKIGEVTNLSPKQIDYIIRSYTGVIGQMGLPALTPSNDKTQTTLQKALKPITQQFVSDPLYSNSAVTDFYDNLDKLKQESADNNISNSLPSKWVTIPERNKAVFTKASTEMSRLNKLLRSATDDKEVRHYKKLILELAQKTNATLK